MHLLGLHTLPHAILLLVQVVAAQVARQGGGVVGGEQWPRQAQTVRGAIGRHRQRKRRRRGRWPLLLLLWLRHRGDLATRDALRLFALLLLGSRAPLSG
eukprot:3839448-Prymnesium_polylepis.1